jgi:hypothetical protein
MAWIFVVSPPRERLIASSPPFFERAGVVLMRTHDGGVDHRVFVVGIVGEGLEKTPPHAGLRPTRAWTFIREPNRSGRSRHGAPERNFQITASTNARLPRSLLRPTLPGRPGRRCSIRANCQSAL